MVVRLCLVYDSQGKWFKKLDLILNNGFMEIKQIRMYELFRNKFGDKEAEEFVHIIEEKMDTKIDQRKYELATKDDIYRLKEEMLTMRTELLRTIYVTSIGQLVAIVASLISLMLFMLKK